MEVKKHTLSWDAVTQRNKQLTIYFTYPGENVVEHSNVDELPRSVWDALKTWVDSRSDVIKTVESVRLDSVDGTGGLVMREINLD